MQLGLLKLGPHMQIRKKLIICKSKVAQKRGGIPTTVPQVHLEAEVVVEAEVEAEAEAEEEVQYILFLCICLLCILQLWQCLRRQHHLHRCHTIIISCRHLNIMANIFIKAAIRWKCSC